MLQSNTVPTLLESLNGAAQLPALSLTSLTLSGLALYLWNAIAQRNTLYIVGNAIGLTLNSVMLALILGII